MMTYMDREDVTICAALIIDGIFKVIIVIMILPVTILVVFSLVMMVS